MSSLTVKTIVGTDLPIFNSNGEAVAGGLLMGDLYRTSTGEVRVVI